MKIVERGKLTLGELMDALRKSDGEDLRSTDTLNVWCTSVESLGYVSVMAAAPIDHCFLRCPLPHMDFAIMHACKSEKRIAWMSRYDSNMSTSRAFSKYLASSGLTKRQLPFGSIAYIGHDMGREEQWGKKVWPGWFRVYAIPVDVEPGRLVEALGAYVEAGGKFSMRSCNDLEVKRALMQPEYDELTDALFVSGVDDDGGQGQAQYMRLTKALDAEARSQSITLSQLPPIFQPEDCRLWLASVALGPPSQLTAMLEMVSAKRSRLIQVLGWPLFVDVAASVVQAEEQEPSRFQSERTGIALEALADLRNYLLEMSEKFPPLMQDPFEGLYPI